jgi:predicted nucleic-acid-binding protein
MSLTEVQKRFWINPSSFKYSKVVKQRKKKKKREFIEDLKFFIKHDPEFMWEILDVLTQNKNIKKELLKEVTEKLIDSE